MPMWVLRQRADLHAKDANAEQQAQSDIAQFRDRHWQAFLQIGLPKVDDERWQYADMSFLQNAFVTAEMNSHDQVHAIIDDYRKQHQDALICVILNGRYEKKYSDVAKIPDDVSVLSWHDQSVFATYMNFINQNQHENAFASLNAALSVGGLFIHVPDHYKLKQPLHIVSLAGEANILHPSHCVLLGKNAEMTLVEHYQSITAHQYLLNTVAHISVDDGAKLNYYKLQNENSNACHIAHTFIRQEKESEVNCHSFSFGSNFSRDELAIYLRGSRAVSKACGFYLLNQNNQYIDHHVDIRHRAPLTSSEMLYKGIVKQKARAVFNGKLYVDQGAEKINAYQANHNLLLSDRAEVYSKPELEIYADDVKCKHGATIGQLDQDALFYLRSRGINHDEAVDILLKGFAEEIFQRIHLIDIKRFFKQMVSG